MSIGISIRGERKFAKWEEFEISAGTPTADKGVKNVNMGTDKGKVTGVGSAPAPACRGELPMLAGAHVCCLSQRIRAEAAPSLFQRSYASFAALRNTLGPTES